jgi:hypothetical protein
MFWSPGSCSEICRSLIGLKMTYEAVSGCQVFIEFCLGRWNDLTV